MQWRVTSKQLRIVKFHAVYTRNKNEGMVPNILMVISGL